MQALPSPVSWSSEESSTAGTTPFSRTSLRPTRSPCSRSTDQEGAHLDEVSIVEIVCWSALHACRHSHQARLPASVPSHACRVSYEVRGTRERDSDAGGDIRRFRTPVASSRIGDSKLVDLLQGERVGRIEVREEGVVPAVDELRQPTTRPGL